ncbi:tetraspanin-18-like [Dorcoceras hygrometricum]|uniref:Tetraspanin-18-like n=1 Tax=Dorcoceras hygrometricum TaxID=472368 RepID=A0A2Z7B572_9LAMI|nr:tetraspanin-18-like [Dorcoceras hygrometricum]
MRTSWCHAVLAFFLKFLNFLQTFIGVSMVIYSAYMLNQWQCNHKDVSFPNLPPPPAVVSFNLNAIGLDFQPLPATWYWRFSHILCFLRDGSKLLRFVHAFMGVGIFLCCITCIGQFAAEALNGCCLCFYALLSTVFVLLELSLVAFISLDHQWQKGLPFDPTGELESLCIFIRRNMDVLQWVGIVVVVIQACFCPCCFYITSASSQSEDDDDIEGDYDYRSRTREPLLPSYSGKACGSPIGDSDIWSSRMRKKYGLNGGGTKPSLLNQSPSSD